MRSPYSLASAHTQRGAALLLFVIFLVMAATYTLLKKVNQTPDETSRDRYTMQQLNTARAALLGYALHGLDPINNTMRPGQLPCPDYTLNGISDPCQININGNVKPGRLPWYSLGLARLRDADNEPLWYVPAIEFNGSQAINSDSNNTRLRMDGKPEPLVALVLAPGAPLDNQSRPSGTAAQVDPARYFEDVNALGDAVYATLPATGTTPFNDHLLAIRLDRFMPKLERRVLNEVAGILGNGPFPNPASIGKTACSDKNTEGLVPLLIVPDPLLTCNIQTLPTFPTWFRDDWQALIWYVMDPSENLSVRRADDTITTDLQTLLFSPGKPLAANNQLPRSNLPTVFDLLDDDENTNGGPLYQDPVNSLTDNDQLLIVSP
ncbi:hypothetical protein MNBD_GAMMA14-1823 [hydrothermal vent metagenome]|uniref:Uncharacterized protein n=1 Tax=hydrothermal vent metagenome TaxID=652676 RepID=A0A3B0YMT4_9ZZZZ